MANMTDVKTYTIEEAIKNIKSNDKAKFDSSIEAHINLGIDHKKPEQNIRTTTTLPHGTGKEKRVAVFASKKVEGADIEFKDSDIDKIMKGEIKPGVDFDVLVVEPQYMPKIAKLGKVLGPQGLMPNPKTGTVSDDVDSAVNQIKRGRMEIRNEANAPIVHTIIGKKSFDNSMLVENFNELINTLRQNRPQKAKPQGYIKSVFVSGSMSPSYKVEL